LLTWSIVDLGPLLVLRVLTKYVVVALLGKQLLEVRLAAKIRVVHNNQHQISHTEIREK
jgi:hypothetical protein